MERRVEAAARTKRGQKQTLIAEGVLRLLLQEESSLPADRFVIKRKHGEKPTCEGFEFSISHTDGAVAVALSSSPVGIDIERLRKPRLGAAARLFSENELQYIREKPETAFWEVWTKKEAYSKRQGTGLSLKLLSVDTLLSPTSELFHTERDGELMLSICGGDNIQISYTTEDALFSAK